MLVKYSTPVRNRLEKTEEMITTGWKFVGILPNGRVVLENQSDQNISSDHGKQVQKTYQT